jgi:hypothetical protein
MTGTKYTHRIRRCKGNHAAWLLVALRDDGSEIDTFGGYTTAMSIDALLKHSRGLLPGPDDVVQIIYLAEEEQRI